MEIYRLNSKPPADIGFNRPNKVSLDDATSSLAITNLKQGIKNPNRVNVYIDSRFAFSLDISQVVDFKLKVGQVLSPSEYIKLQKASDFGKLYQRTLEWVLLRPRSISETKTYLREKHRKASSDEHDYTREEQVEFSRTIIDKLVSKGYLNDFVFAKWYVENRFVKKGVSRKRLKMELMKKGISQEIIDEVLDSRSDEEEIHKIIARKLSKYDDPQKLTAYLCRQGFSYDLVQKIVEETKN